MRRPRRMLRRPRCCRTAGAEEGCMAMATTRRHTTRRTSNPSTRSAPFSSAFGRHRGDAAARGARSGTGATSGTGPVAVPAQKPGVAPPRAKTWATVVVASSATTFPSRADPARQQWSVRDDSRRVSGAGDGRPGGCAGLQQLLRWRQLPAPVVHGVSLAVRSACRASWAGLRAGLCPGVRAAVRRWVRGWLRCRGRARLRGTARAAHGQRALLQWR